MNRKIIFISITLIFCVLFIPSLSVSASDITPEKYNFDLVDYASNLESKYKINIEYPIRSDGYAAIGTATLSTLDTSLSYLSSGVVRQLSNYYLNYNGTALTFKYAYLPKDYSERDIAALGYFSSHNSTIQLFIPTKDANMTMTGNSPVAILHEMGHAFHFFLSNKHGKTSLEKEWVVFNEGFAYGYYTENPNKYVYMSFYSSTSYEEDFAETFAYAFSSNRSGLGLSPRLYDKNGLLTSLGGKIRFIEKKIPLYLTNTMGAQISLDKMYNASSTLYYNGFYLSGNSLEYIGFNQPSGILPAILENLKINAVTTEWVWDVGGWRVSDKNSGVYLIFPGSGYVTIVKPKK